MGFSLEAMYSRNKSGGETSNSSSVQEREEEKELNKLLLEQYKKTQPEMENTQLQALQYVQDLMSGLPVGGVGSTQYGITPEQSQAMATQAAEGVLPMFNQAGAMDSGAAQAAATDAYANILNQNSQFNVQSALNLINSILSGQVAAQSPGTATTQQLSTNLAGLRGGTNLGSWTQAGLSYGGKGQMTGEGSSQGGGGDASSLMSLFGGG